MIWECACSIKTEFARTGVGSDPGSGCGEGTPHMTKHRWLGAPSGDASWLQSPMWGRDGLPDQVPGGQSSTPAMARSAVNHTIMGQIAEMSGLQARSTTSRLRGAASWTVASTRRIRGGAFCCISRRSVQAHLHHVDAFRSFHAIPLDRASSHSLSTLTASLAAEPADANLIFFIPSFSFNASSSCRGSFLKSGALDFARYTI